MMEVTVKVRFNASREHVEQFGSSKYVMYLPFPEDDDAISVIVSLLSRHIGMPAKDIEFKTKNTLTKDWIFYVN